MARTLGMGTVAEGVEDAAQLELLEQAGCDAIQGYLVAKPMQLALLLRLLERWGEGDTASMPHQAAPPRVAAGHGPVPVDAATPRSRGLALAGVVLPLRDDPAPLRSPRRRHGRG